MAVCYAPVIRFYDLEPQWSLTLPLVALFYVGATIWSAWSNKGGEWKGRVQDPGIRETSRSGNA